MKYCLDCKAKTTSRARHTCFCGGEMVDAKAFEDLVGGIKAMTYPYSSITEEKLRKEFDEGWRKVIGKAIRAGVSSEDQLVQLRKVFGEDWEEVLDHILKTKDPMAAKAIGANIAKALGGETIMTGYKATEDLGELLDEAIARLETVNEAVPPELRQALGTLEALAEEQRGGDEDEEYPKKRGRKVADDHPLARLASGTPLGPRRPARPVRAKYKAGEDGIARLVEVDYASTDTKTASSRRHPTLDRLGSPLAITTGEHYARLEEARSGKTVTTESPLLRRDTPLHKTGEDLERARLKYEQEEAIRQADKEAARPRERYKFVSCPVCGHSHRIAKAGLQRTSRYCPQHGDIMQPTPGPADTATARKSAARPDLGGGGGY